MITFIENMRVSRAILLVVAVPVIAAIMFANNIVSRESALVDDLHSLQTLTELSTHMSNLVHEQQKERGATAGFLSSKGKKFGDVLAKQRQETDTKKTALFNYLAAFGAANYEKSFQDSLSSLVDNTKKMGGIRSQVDGLSIPASQAIGYYTGLNSENLKIIGSLTLLSQNAEITNYIHTYVNFLQSKERAGIERAVGAGNFSKGSFAPKALDKFKKLITIQDTYLRAFSVTATQEQKAAVAKLLKTGAVSEVNDMRNVAFTSSNDTSAVKAEVWFATITKKINGLKKIEDSLAKDLMDKSAAVSALAEASKRSALTQAFISMAIVFVLAWFIIRMLSSGMKGMTEAMTELAEGNTNVDIPATDLSNELGEMAEAVQVFKENAMANKRMLEDQKEAGIKAKEDKKQAMNEMAGSFEARVQGIIQSVSSSSIELTQTAQEMSAVIVESSNKVNEANVSAGQTSQNVQSVASAAEEMSATVKEISSQVAKSNSLVEQSMEKVESADAHATALSESSQRVREVVQLIADISGQINLLALNATIESARAGDAGKGFAVVAGEVKNLATQTDKSIQEIERVIGEMNVVSNDIVMSLNEIKESVVAISQTSQSVGAAVEEQSAATNEIASSMQSAAQGTSFISENLQTIHEGSTQSQAASEQVLGASQELSEQAEKLQREVSEFLAGVRVE